LATGRDLQTVMQNVSGSKLVLHPWSFLVSHVLFCLFYFLISSVVKWLH